MSELGPIEDTPITWQPANTNCPICSQPQYHGFKDQQYVGICCPSGHWNPDPVMPPVPLIPGASTTTTQTEQGTPKEWMKPLTDEQMEQINSLQEKCELLTNQMKTLYTEREQYRQTIAALTCPFTVGQHIETGTGQAPKDRKVITLIRGGDTYNGEFWRAWSRVLKKDGKLGEKAYRVHPSDKGFRSKGMYTGVEGLPKEEIEEDMVI